MGFDGWDGIVRVLLVGPAAYAALVLILRVSGKRTLSKLNAFDLVVTVALGSCLATILLSKDVALAEGLAAFGVLVAGQYAISWLSVRSGVARRVFKSEPRLLLWEGQPIRAALREERVTPAELESAARAHGIGSAADCAAIVLETDGSLHVMGGPADKPALAGVRGTPSPPAPPAGRAT